MDWTGARYADKPTIEVQTWICAPAQTVWDLVSDIEAMPGTSEELQSVRWLDDRTAPCLGARFEGHNRHQALGEWTTVSHVVEYQPLRVFAWAVQDPDNPSAVWRFSLEPKDEGTLLRQWLQLGPGPSGLSYAIDQMPDKEQKIVFVRLREFEAAMQTTVKAIKELAEGETAAEGSGKASE
ncbi:SRPBCC family protein [Streptomyces sp. NPDC000345]|uniref:SRPBCC family protein n=1 Tax=Streptomyces sp. NPDC000345 TaxID=3364537 RepID=UPI0036AF339A